MNTLLQAVFFNIHLVLTLFALGAGSFAIAVFLYQVRVEKRRKFPLHNPSDFSVLDE